MIDIKAIASGSSGNCYRVSDGSTALLLDAGIPIHRIQQGIDYRLGEIAGALISHEHMDHAKAVPELARRGLLIFGPPEVAKACACPSILSGPPLRKFTVSTWNIVPFKVVHDVTCYGYVLDSRKTGERLVYITDAAAVPYTFGQVHYMMLEANYSMNILSRRATEGAIKDELAARIAQTHMDIDGAIGLLRGLNPRVLKQVWLLHLSRDNSDADAFRRMAQRTTGAEVYIA
ncbi:MBL fold metallo-hydrolase [uncultured Selenomonas sp.]|uniref:MBL fold metallo-hydrolase n=1 Tax=uncultured Selenomonas sp. TaxID=159275 RepID=UPI00258B398D|nr:MBL fold metallo-hydrolase [uncultured Selenomonas sp.]